MERSNKTERLIAMVKMLNDSQEVTVAKASVNSDVLSRQEDTPLDEVMAELLDILNEDGLNVRISLSFFGTPSDVKADELALKRGRAVNLMDMKVLTSGNPFVGALVEPETNEDILASAVKLEEVSSVKEKAGLGTQITPGRFNLK